MSRFRIRYKVSGTRIQPPHCIHARTTVTAVPSSLHRRLTASSPSKLAPCVCTLIIDDDDRRIMILLMIAASAMRLRKHRMGCARCLHGDQSRRRLKIRLVCCLDITIRYNRCGNGQDLSHSSHCSFFRRSQTSRFSSKTVCFFQTLTSPLPTSTTAI